jgi:hypothetical protein
VPISGRLFLGVNDNSFPDNSGSWATTVTVTSNQPPEGPRPMSRIPEGRAPNLIVLVHGCCTDENGVKEWDELGRLIAGTIQTPEAWEVVVWDWSFITKICLTFPGCLKDAYDLAPDVGSNLKDAITDAINISFVNSYEYIHFIGHSAGAKLIHEASKKLAEDKALKKRPFIHLTFLDAYTRTKKDSGEKGGKGYGYLEGYPEHYSEHYVDRSLPSTDAILPNAFNFDITDWQPITSEDKKDAGHQWPRYWYKQSVTTPGFRDGYRLSLEGGNELFRNLATQFPAGGCVKLKSITEIATCN